MMPHDSLEEDPPQEEGRIVEGIEGKLNGTN